MVASAATTAWRTGDKEALRRLEFWFLYHRIAVKADLQSRQFLLSPGEFARLEQIPWHLGTFWDQPVTARHCAKALIYTEVVRGDPVDLLARCGQGSSNVLFDAQIGGYLYARDEWENPDAQPIDLGPWRIGVGHVLGVSCKKVFSLQDLYTEIQREARGEALVQLSLF